jgi:hypothetical protein
MRRWRTSKAVRRNSGKQSIMQAKHLIFFVQERGGAQPSPWRVVDVDNINCKCDEGRIIEQSEERIYIRLLGSFRRRRRSTAMATSATTLRKALTCIRILVF